MSGLEVVTTIVAPLLAAYAFFLALLLRAWRRPRARGVGPRGSAPLPPPHPRWRRLVPPLSTVTGGFVLFAALAGSACAALPGASGDCLADVVGAGAFLSFAVAAPLFSLAAWIMRVSPADPRQGRIPPIRRPPLGLPARRVGGHVALGLARAAPADAVRRGRGSIVPAPPEPRHPAGAGAP